MAGKITIEANPLEVKLETDDIHPGLLRDELVAHLGDKVHGISHTAGNARAHIPTTVKPELVAQITDALKGFETRLGGDYSRQADLDYLRTKYSNVIVDAVADGSIGTFVDQCVASLVGPRKEGETPEQFYGRVHTARNDAMVINARNAQNEFSNRQNVFDIRTKLLEELRAKFGDKIQNLSIIHGDATVHVLGDYDPATVKAIHEKVKAHDKTKAPPEPPSDQEVLLKTLMTMNDQLQAALKRIEALEGKKAK